MVITNLLLEQRQVEAYTALIREIGEKDLITREIRRQWGVPMAMQVRIHNPARAKEFFDAKMAFTTGPVELERIMKTGEVNVVDVRAAEDYAAGHIPGAVSLPKDQWHTLKGLSKDRANVLYCYSIVCQLAATAAVEFAGRGYPVMELDGGWRWWKENGFEVEK